jgi:hypothetical protein
MYKWENERMEYIIVKMSTERYRRNERGSEHNRRSKGITKLNQRNEYNGIFK